MRRELKKRGVKKLKVVYSEEQPIQPIEDMSISCRANCICPPGAKHKCTERRAIPGSVAFVPSVVGLIIAGEVVKDAMKKCKITVMRKACYKDLMKKYENPMEHACDMEEGQVFIANGWSKPDGMCDSAWESMSPFVMTLAYEERDV